MKVRKKLVNIGINPEMMKCLGVLKQSSLRCLSLPRCGLEITLYIYIYISRIVATYIKLLLTVRKFSLKGSGVLGWLGLVVDGLPRFGLGISYSCIV